MESSAEWARVVAPAGRGALDTLPSAPVLPNPSQRSTVPRRPPNGTGCRGAVDHRLVTASAPSSSLPNRRRRGGRTAALALLIAAVAAFATAAPAAARAIGLAGIVDLQHPAAEAEATADHREPWLWPVPAPIRVVAPFRAPPTPYAAGHRGIDVAVEQGTEILAPAAGVVSFAGQVAGRGVVAIDHGDGVVSAIEPVDAMVTAGTTVAMADQIGVAASGGHCAAHCVHFGVRIDGEYVSPFLFLGGLPPAVLLPMR